MTSRRPRRPVIFDLDGTLCDSGPLIASCISRTLEDAGYGPRESASLIPLIGASLPETFSALTGLDEYDTGALVGSYRSRYSEVMHDAPVYPGIEGLLARLRDSDVPLAVATSKLESQAREILSRIGLDNYFMNISGSSPDGRVVTKAEIIQSALHGLARMEVETSGAIVVGDRIHDVRGAEAHNCRAVFVTWGYGALGEGDRAQAIARSVSELETLLTSMGGRTH